MRNVRGSRSYDRGTFLAVPKFAPPPPQRPDEAMSLFLPLRSSAGTLVPHLEAESADHGIQRLKAERGLMQSMYADSQERLSVSQETRDQGLFPTIP